MTRRLEELFRDKQAQPCIMQALLGQSHAPAVLHHRRAQHSSQRLQRLIIAPAQSRNPTRHVARAGAFVRQCLHPEASQFPKP